MLAVFGERLSGFKFPVKRENTGKFCKSSREGAKRDQFSVISQLLTPKFPTHPNREFYGANRELFPAEQGKSLSKSPADGIFGKDRTATAARCGFTDSDRRQARPKLKIQSRVAL